MATDRIIQFSEQLPNRDDISRFLTNYVGESGSLEWVGCVAILSLQGSLSRPFTLDDRETEQDDRERWIEVWIHDEVINVLTREMDSFTVDIANGIARRIAGLWCGNLSQ